MTAPWLPTPRQPADNQLADRLAAATAVTRHDRREHDTVGAALTAVARLEAAT